MMGYSVLETEESVDRVRRAAEALSDAFGELELTLGECLVVCQSFIEAIEAYVEDDIMLGDGEEPVGLLGRDGS